jgi:hypothetical protein
MIYLLDEKLTDHSHSKYILNIIKNHTDIDVELIEVSQQPTVGEIDNIVQDLHKKVLPTDIVLCCWVVEANEIIDDIFDDLSNQCWVVVAAGNFNNDITFWSPARAKRVITVACLNKSGIKAMLSNYGESKELVWVPGTNYNVGWKNSSGTSVSAAVYAAFLAEAIKEKDFDLLTELLNKYSIKVKNELL